MKWNDAQMDELLLKSLPSWIAHDRAKLLALCHAAESPGTLRYDLKNYQA
jgi:hypothetical protein